MEIKEWCLLTMFLLSQQADGLKILVVFPFPAKSHHNLGNGYVRHLLKAGHEVTYITPFPVEPQSKLRQIDVSNNRKNFPENAINIKGFFDSAAASLNDENLLFFSVFNVAEKNFDNANVIQLLNDPQEQFDVVVAEWMYNELYAGIAEVFSCPFIWSFPYEPYGMVLSLIDEPTNPAYTPSMLSTNIPPFNFFQRVQELLVQSYGLALKNFYHYDYEKAAYERIFGPILAKREKRLPDFYDVKYNASIMFGCSHVSLGQPTRLPQNYKDIGGFHIDENVQPLPEDLQKIMDSAKKGVIYFSMGSNLKSKDLPIEIKQNILKVFGELEQTVIWKFEEDFKDSLPKNVHVIKWAPQPSILSHTNCVLFITHGGLLSITETIHFGVPIIGIPVFTDQFNNVNRAVQKGFGKKVQISYSLADELKVAIIDMVSDSSYRNKARSLSAIYHDRVVPPGRELVHWVEHVVRTRGAPHLRSPALMVPWYQKMYLDLLAFILIVVYVIRSALKRLYSKLFPKKKARTSKKKN